MKPAIVTTRTILLAGFGGMAALIVAIGLDTTAVIRRVHDREQQVRWDFESRSRLLDQIRADLHLSGNFARDYLLDIDSARAEDHRASLTATRRRMESDVAAYESLLSAGERELFSSLRQRLDSYWRIFDPVLSWTPRHRREYAEPFLHDEVLSRRTMTLEIAAQIASANDKLFGAGADSVESIFAAFRGRLLTALAIAMALGISLAVVASRRILRLESETAIRHERTRRACERLRELSASLLAAREGERRLISRELTDDVAQALAVVMVELENLLADLPAQVNGTVHARADVIRSVAGRTAVAVEKLSVRLRPSLLDQLGVVPALRWQARETSRRTGMQVTVFAGDAPSRLPEDVRTCVFRIVQEILQGCESHGGVSQVRIGLRMEADTRLVLSVHSDRRLEEPLEGLLLIGIEQRVTQLKGISRLDRQPEGGNVITVALPVAV